MSRPPLIRGAFEGGLIVDLFAGGGGASLGIEMALGRSVDIAINHSRAAVAMHERNHPRTRHYCEDVFAVDPREAVGRRKVDLLWASPDCTHHSRAKGGKPRERKRRALAAVVLRWAAMVRPRLILLENVEEFASWGPLDDEGYPIRELAGRYFDAWVADLELQGYTVERRLLVAADYGAPTTRRRLFLVARRDGAPIVWPEPTHGAGRALPWRAAAAEVIDWSLPCPSIFERSKPLAEATMRRIARGIRRYVLEAAEPFIVPVTHPRDARVHRLSEPLRTVTCAPRGEMALVSPALIQTSYGERKGQAPRTLDIHKPLGTVVASGQKHALVAAFLAKHYGGNEGPGTDLRRAVDTITTQDHHSLVAAHLTPTVTAGGEHIAEVRAFLVKYYGTAAGADVREPLDTVTTRDRFGLVTVGGEDYAIADIGMRMLQPHELFAAQGFPADYDLLEGELTKTERIELCGNSVCPPVAAALVRAQFGIAQAVAA